MDKDIKLYSQKAIGIATFLGGPLAAGFLIRKNFINLNKESAGLMAAILGVVFTFILFAGLFLLPENIAEKIPNSILPAIYTALIYLVVEKIQGRDIKSHESKNGQFYSGWKAAGAGFIGLIIIGLTAFIAGDLFGTPNFDAIKYDSGISEFSSNENEALKIYVDTDSKTDRRLISELNEGIDLWEKNIVILNGLDSIENLPAEFLNQNSLLQEYCNLRIEHYGLIRQSIKEGTTKYDVQIQQLGLKIDSILEAL